MFSKLFFFIILEKSKNKNNKSSLSYALKRITIDVI